MTRAKQELAIIAQAGKESAFFVELVRTLQSTGAVVTSSTDTHGSVGTIELCPGCSSGTLVPRKGRYGPFYGCSTYPNCTFTHDPRRGPIGGRR